MRDRFARLITYLETNYWPFFAVLLAIVVLRLPIDVSLWLDETVTAWITSSSLPDVIARTTRYQGQSPLYYLLVWGGRPFVGSSEPALRTLSLVAGVGCVWLIYRIALRLLTPNLAAIAALVFISLDPVQVAWISARPYALALFGALLSTLILLRWLASGKKRDLYLYLLTLVLTFYIHYLFIAIALVHVVIALVRTNLSTQKWPELVGPLLIVIPLLLPGIFHLIDLSRREEIRFLASPTLLDLLLVAAPPVLVIALVLGGFASLLVSTREWSRGILAKRGAAELITWFLLPPVFFFLAASLADFSIFAPRYFLFYTGGLACTAAWLASLIANSRARLCALTVVTLLLMVKEGGRTWAIEDWRAALSSVAHAKDQNAPVYIYSGLAEAKLIDTPTKLACTKDEIGALLCRDASDLPYYLASPALYYQPGRDIFVSGPCLIRQARGGGVPGMTGQEPFFVTAFQASSASKDCAPLPESGAVKALRLFPITVSGRTESWRFESSKLDNSK